MLLQVSNTTGGGEPSGTCRAVCASRAPQAGRRDRDRARDAAMFAVNGVFDLIRLYLRCVRVVPTTARERPVILSPRFVLLADQTTLEETIALLEATLDATHDGILVVDPSRRVIRFNRRFVEMFRVPPE